MKYARLLLVLSAFSNAAYGQMWNGSDTLYGNEWIDHSLQYFKIKIADDAVYRIPYAALTDAGVPLSQIPAADFRLFRNGQQVPVFISTNGFLGDQDFIEFYGEKNRGETDRFLFNNPDREQLNPRFSMFNDTAVYFLCWTTAGTPLRYTAADNNLNNAPAPEPYCWFEKETLYNALHFKWERSVDIKYSWFDGNGYGQSNPGANIIYPDSAYANGPAPFLDIRFMMGSGSHMYKLLVNGQVFDSLAFNNLFLLDSSYQLPANFLAGPIEVLAKSTLANDYLYMAYARLRYPRKLFFQDLGLVQFRSTGASADPYFEIGGLANAGAVLVYDRSQLLRLTAVKDGALQKIHLPAASGARELLLTTPTAIRTVSTLTPVTFRNYAQETDIDYVILTHPEFFSDPKSGGANHIQAYADYRSGAAGGNHKVAVVDINDLYDQFGYGVRFNPLGMRNFCHYIHKKWPQVQNLLIIGKGLDYDTFRSASTQQSLADSLFFVPMYASPGADLPFVMAPNDISQPIFAVGRLPVTQPYEIRNYLDKVIEYEATAASAGQSITEKAWMKRVLQLSGGNEEALAIKYYLAGMANTMANGRMGADVHTLYKTSNDPVQIAAFEQILDLVNDGVSLWMVFGHSSPNIIDFDIGLPEAYNNQGRYPFLMLMGCNSGTCSTKSQGIGERFTLAPKRGAIAYVATVNYGFTHALNDFGQRYSQRISGDDYGKSIGESINNTVGSFAGNSYDALTALLHQNVLQGDPAIRLNQTLGPDYTVDAGLSAIAPNPVGLQQDSFHLSLELVNLGENTAAQLPLRIEQRLPDNTLRTLVLDTIPAPAFRETLHYAFPTSGSQVGFNRFFAAIDPGNSVTEQPAAAETNNDWRDAGGQIGVDVFFFDNDVQPIFPPDFGIVGNADIRLFASSLKPGNANAAYRFELDTSGGFDSPWKKSAMLLQQGGLISWNPGQIWTDSTVYYWRVAPDTLIDNALVWRSASFLYLQGSPEGWNQSHSDQFAGNKLINLQWVDSLQRLEFISNAGYLTVKLDWRGSLRFPAIDNSFYEGFISSYQLGGIGETEVAVFVADPKTGHFWLNQPGSAYNPGASPLKYFKFNTQLEQERGKLMNFLQNDLPDGYPSAFVAFSNLSDQLGYAPKLWAADSITLGQNLFQVLESLGAQKVRDLTNYTTVPWPYALIFSKNDPDFLPAEAYITHPDSLAQLYRTFPTKWATGLAETPLIGPALQWDSLHFRHAAFDDPSDQAVLSLFGVRPDAPDTLLLSLHAPLDTSLQWIDVQQFPCLRLRYDLRDTVARTATQPEVFRITYRGLPEGAIHSAAHFNFFKDTLEQGQPLAFSVAFRNVSAAGMDSLRVDYRIESTGGPGEQRSLRLPPLPPGDTLQIGFTHPTYALSGPQRLVLDVNPENDQPERYHLNNVWVQDFYVQTDHRNPLLDVTFDGVHILDGDIVSPTPEIALTMKDENKFLALEDTATFRLWLELPNGQVRQLWFSDPAVQFTPADPQQLPGKNKARLDWRPEFTTDGYYTLRVNGRDASGNPSGAVDFRIKFQVYTRDALSNVLNYPNPFSTSTCFVYTLTGDEPPADFRLQIMTISGKVVREITAAEFGPLRPGTHLSDYCWDGRDQFGDQLANGVYLYRVLAKKADGSDFDAFENSEADGFFKNEFGKMVLIR